MISTHHKSEFTTSLHTKQSMKRVSVYWKSLTVWTRERTENNMQVYRENRKFIKSWLLHLLTIICIHSSNFKIGKFETHSSTLQAQRFFFSCCFCYQTEFMMSEFNNQSGAISIWMNCNWCSFGKSNLLCACQMNISFQFEKLMYASLFMVCRKASL